MIEGFESSAARAAMGELIVRDNRELRRIERAIAAIECRPVCDQMRMQALLVALQAERSALQGFRRRRSPLQGDTAI